MTPKRVRTVEGSCWACKDRRVICDLQRPQCSRCISEDQPCEYGKFRLRWCNGVAARGRFAGQNVPVSGSNDHHINDTHHQHDGDEHSSSSSPLLLTEEEDSKDEEVMEGEDESEGRAKNRIQDRSLSSASTNTTRTVSSSTSIYRHAFDISGMPSLETPDQLLLYFEHIVIDRFNLSAEPVLVDLASVYKHPALRYAVTAVANAHQQLSLCPGRTDALLSQRKARLKAIQNFRTQLQSPYQAQQQLRASRRFLPADLFTANVLLCILDGVIDPHDESAATHVHYRGGRAILSQWKLQQQLQRQKRGLPALMLSCFMTMDLTYSLLSGEEQYFQPSTWAQLAGSDGWWGVLPEGDPFLDTMRILSRLAQLGHLARGAGSRHNRSTNNMVVDEIQALAAALRGYTTPTDGDVIAHGYPPSPSSSSSFVTTFQDAKAEAYAPLAASLLVPMTSTESQFDYDQSWTVFCNAYRLAGLIYLYRVFHHLEVTHPLIQKITSYGLQAICETRLKGKLAHCLLFPALVIGANCRTPSQQRAVLSAMRSTATFLKFGSMRVMENFLQQVWARNGSSSSTPIINGDDNDDNEVNESWWQCFEPISRKTFLF